MKLLMNQENFIAGKWQRRPLHVGRPNIGNRAVFDSLVNEIFERRWFTNSGVVVRELEKRLEERLGVDHCVAVSNATVGLQVACQSMDLSGEVILPSFTFVATANAIVQAGLVPVFADVDPETHCLCPKDVESVVTEKTAAILGVHLWGTPCNPQRLAHIAERNDLKLFFDAAHAFHNTYRETAVGNFGNCEVFSFHATKFFNTFEGGMVATNDGVLAERIRKMINFGFDGPGSISCIGTNAKMSEISAAMGLSMLPCVDILASKNRRCYVTYREALQNVAGLKVYSIDSRNRSNFQYVVVEISEAEFGCSRDRVVEYLHDHRVYAKPYFHPGCHRLKPYRGAFALTGRQLPQTERLADCTLCLPMGGDITISEIKEVCSLILQSRNWTGETDALHQKRKAAG